MSFLRRLSIWNEAGTESARITNGGLDVNIQDQHTAAISIALLHEEGTPVLSGAVSVDDITINVNSGHGVIAGKTVEIYEGAHVYQGTALSVTATSITLDTPIDCGFTTGAVVKYGYTNMAVDGSSTPVSFRVSPQYLADGTEWDITRIIIVITDDAAMDSGTFGGIASLTNGVVFRSENGSCNNLFNAKSNGDFANEMYDVSYDDRNLPPAGLAGFRGRRTYAGQDKSGVVLRLGATDNGKLVLYVQDDLSGLTSMQIRAHGHIVE